MKVTTVNHRQAAAAIKALGHKRTIIIQGEAGIGKTALQYEFMRDPMFAGHHVMPPIDCTQLADGSVAMMDLDRERGVSIELPNSRFGISRTSQRGINGSKPVVICLDEVGKAKKFVKDMIAPVLYERRIGERYFPEPSYIFGATNLALEGLGDMFEPHMLDRIIVLRMAKPTAEEWVMWGADAGIHEMILATARMHANIFDTFTDYLPGGKYAGKNQSKEAPCIFDPRNSTQDKWVTPRSLHASSDILHERHKFDDITLQLLLEGTVGRTFAENIMANIRFGEQMPPFQQVLDEPTTCPLPGNSTAQLVQVFQFVTRVKDADMAEAVSVYVTRMKEEMQSLFAYSASFSGRESEFCTSATFGKLLMKHKQYFNN